MQRTNSVRNGPLVSDVSIRDVLRREMERAINAERTFSRAQLANESGVNIHTIDAIRTHDVSKQRRIAMEDAFSLAQVLGSRAVNALVALISYGAYHLTETGDPDLADIMADSMGHLQTIARALADGIIEPHEEEDTQQAADGLIDTVTPLSSRRLRA